MKLVIGIINSDDSNELLSAVTKAGFQATKLSTSGGFLKIGNITVLIGVEDEKTDEVIEIFKTCCSRRTQLLQATPPYFSEGFVSMAPVEVTVGGATLFVIDVDKMIKL